MTDAQNERTNGKNRRRGRRRGRNQRPDSRPAMEATPAVQDPAPVPAPPEPVAKVEVRPDEIAPPTTRSEEYCVHHMANFTECEPMQERTQMTTLRHLQVDHFGEATLYCDCLHNGPHQWPPSMQKLETAIELDQFKAASSSDA